MSNLAQVLECVVSASSRRTAPALSRPIRVLLDSRKIQDGGIGTHIQNLISGLTTIDGVEVTALTYPDRSYLATQCGANAIIEDSSPGYSLEEMFLMSRRIDFSSFDIYHSPHFILPFGIKIPTIVTVHDVIQISHPERFFYPMVAKRLIGSSIRRANKVVTVSNATSRELTRLFPKASQKIRVIPNAVDPFFLSETFLRDVPPDQSERGSYIVATFSNLKPHKGLEDLLSAFENLKVLASRLPKEDVLAKAIKDLKLVLVGQGTESLKAEKLRDDVLVAGRVSIRELHKLYSSAQALIVASVVEGFCLPVIEAQACATPVIARPTPAVVELMTTNDVLVADFTVDSLTDSLYQFFSKRVYNPELIEYAVPLGHMRRFDREDIALSVTELYQSML